MNLFFTLWNVELQDCGFDIVVGNKFSNCFNIEICDNLELINKKIKTELIHIKDNEYEVLCYVYEKFNNIAFVEIDGLNFMVDLKKQNLKKGSYYKFIGAFYSTQWNYLGLSSEKVYDKFYKQFKIAGIIKSIAFDTASSMKPIDSQYTGEYIEPKFDYKIKNSTNFGWGEEELYPESSGNYLVEIDIEKQSKLIIEN